MLKKIVNWGKEKINLKEKLAEKTFPYLDLLSENSPKDYDEYHTEADILDNQIRKKNVNNIAIVAKYGAGKSSAINTYLKKYRNKAKGDPKKNKYARISLATFNSEKDNETYNESSIERSILQQLLYSRQKSDLPNSKIERTNITSLFLSILKALLISAFIGSSVLFGLEIGGIYLFCNENTAFILFGLAILFLFFIIFYLFHYKKLNRIKYKDLEADFNTESENHQTSQIANLINKFMDEVLYFFECINVDLVIFEDLDRLQTTKIFVKLRELNTIINGSGVSKNKVTFLYAVKDELIKTEEERAKFFEFILPIIPIINPVTTEDMLRKKTGELILKNEKLNIHDRFIKGIAGYIPDMRILNNTFNDYIIMYHRIFEDKFARTDDMANEKLFSICLYKNLFPYDYALLEKNKGLVALIINLPNIRNYFAETTIENIANTRKRIEELKKEKLNSFKELKDMFIGQIVSMQHGSSASANSIDVTKIETFDGLDFSNIKHPIPKVQNNNHNYNQPRTNYYLVNLQEQEILTLSKEKYFDKEEKIIEKCNNGVEKLNTKIVELEKEKQNVLSLSFSQIIKNMVLLV